MITPERHTLAIVGAGPIGLEAALAAMDRGFDVHVFEQGEPGAHPAAWGHVRLFTPWRMNVGPASRRHLEAAGWKMPDPDTLPTGAEYVERYIAPLARLEAFRGRLHTHAQVTHIGRRGLLKSDSGRERRRQQPFRLLVRDQGGRENFLHAFSVIDASGVYANPNRAGDGGIPARQELYLAPQMAYHLEDVLGDRREHYAGRSVMVVGAGASAATTVSDLAALAEEAPGTRVVWVTRRPAAALYAAIPNDPLAARAELYARARALARGASEAVTLVDGALVEGFEYNSATHQYRVTLLVDGTPRQETVDRVIVHTGFGPDNALYRELQVHECYETRGPMKLAASLQGSTDCLDVPDAGPEVLRNPEPDFYILGNKSYGRNPHFLLETGFRHVGEVIEMLAADQGLPAPAARA